MAYNAKTNWILDEIVEPEDINRIEQGIKDAHEEKLDKNSNAVSATKLFAKRTIALSGGVTGTATEFDGSQNITIPVTSVNPDNLSKATPISKGGTGNSSFTAGKVLVGNGTNPLSEKNIDSTVGGTENSSDLITSGAVKAGLDTKLGANSNAVSATKLFTSRKIALSGAVTGTATSFDGTQDITIPVTSVNPDNLSKEVPVSKGGTGKNTFTVGSVLVGNGTNAVGERSIDNTEGGTASSTSLITSGAVRAALNKKLDATANAVSASKLATKRTMRTSLQNTAYAQFDGSEGVTLGVEGILPITHGGTGSNSVNGAITNLGIMLVGDTTISVTTGGNDTTGNGTAEAPFRTINKALSTLPKNLNGKTTIIQIGAGTYNETVAIRKFFGGNIILQGVSGASVTVTGLTVENANVFVNGLVLNVGSGGIFISEDGLLYSASSNINVNGAVNGVTLRYGAKLEVSTTLTINNASGNALWVQYNSLASVNVLAGTGNNVGINIMNSIVYCQRNNIAATVSSGVVAGQLLV